MYRFPGREADDLDIFLDDFHLRRIGGKMRSEDDDIDSWTCDVSVEFIGMGLKSADMWRIEGREDKNFQSISHR